MTRSTARNRFAQYRRAWYRFEADENVIELRIGKTSREMDDLLRDDGKRRWAFITAFNPGLRFLSPRENARRTRLLAVDLKRAGHVIYPGAGGDDEDESKQEAGFFILGISARAGETLRRRYEQDCIATGVRGGRAELSPSGET